MKNPDNSPDFRTIYNSLEYISQENLTSFQTHQEIQKIRKHFQKIQNPESKEICRKIIQKKTQNLIPNTSLNILQNYSLTLPANPDKFQPLVEYITGLAQEWSEEKQFALRECLDEAIINAIKHGNKQKGNINITFRKKPKSLIFIVQDQGNGFNPEKIPNPLENENLESDHGRGILLMKAYSDNLKYNKKGNKLAIRIKNG